MIGSHRSLFAVRAAEFALVVLLTLAAVSASAQGRGRGGHNSGGQDTTPPTAPAHLRATSITQSTVSLTWDPSTDNSGQLTYVVRMGESDYRWVPQSTPATTYTGLLPSQTYSFAVFAIDPTGNRSAESNTLSVTLLADTTPPSAPVLSVTEVTQGRAVIDWTPSTDDVTAVTYEVFINGVQAALGDNLFWRGDGTAANVLRLAPSSTYKIVVRAKDSSSNPSAFSNAVTIVTPPSADVTAPSMPRDLRVTEDLGCGLIGIGWTQSTDDLTPQSAIRYEVYVNGFFLEGATVTGAGSGDAWNLTQPTNTITVIAFDSSGNASPPATIQY